jgi:hypothetical protein
MDRPKRTGSTTARRCQRAIRTPPAGSIALRSRGRSCSQSGQPPRNAAAGSRPERHPTRSRGSSSRDWSAEVTDSFALGMENRVGSTGPRRWYLMKLLGPMFKSLTLRDVGTVRWSAIWHGRWPVRARHRSGARGERRMHRCAPTRVALPMQKNMTYLGTAPGFRNRSHAGWRAPSPPTHRPSGKNPGTLRSQAVGRAAFIPAQPGRPRPNLSPRRYRRNRRTRE